MAYIYKIVNDINQKIYVGKTEFDINKRFQEHCRDAFKNHNEKRPLYAAMQKYGIEHFHIELIEQTDIPNEREIYWIEHLKTFKYGYNATLGGDGKRYLDYDLIIETFKQTKTYHKTAQLIGCSRDTVEAIIKEYKLTEYNDPTANIRKMVNQYDLQGNYIKTYASAFEAAKAIGKITPTSNGATSHITRVCKGQRKTAYGYKWQFVNL